MTPPTVPEAGPQPVERHNQSCVTATALESGHHRCQCLCHDALERAANEGRNVLPDATDDQAAVIEQWAASVTPPSSPRAGEAEGGVRLTPAEIHDLDMALRYALLDHDYECRAIGMENNCTCPARGHADRARAIVKRVGAPYRLPSGDYDRAALASPEPDPPDHVTDEDDPLACWCDPYRDSEEPIVIIHRKQGEA
jgi:hypothetical protein